MDTVVSINDNGTRVCYELTDRGRFGHRLSVSTYQDSTLVRTSKTYIEHDIYRFCVGDVDADGTTDVCVGVIKHTRFDPIYRKRLFIYTHRSGIISPLWMGSKVGNNLQDFIAFKYGTELFIRTVEEHPDGGYSVGEYKWRSFGLIWQRYIKKGISREEAFTALTI